MIDFRYHMASLIAVFLALGIGILIGCLVIGGNFHESMINEQGQWIGKLEQEFSLIKETSNNLRQEIKNKDQEIVFLQQFLKNISSYIMEERLAGKTIILYESEESRNGQLAWELLKQAGAMVCRGYGGGKFDLVLGDYQEIDGLVLISTSSQVEGLNSFLLSDLQAQVPICVIDNDLLVFDRPGILRIQDLTNLQSQIDLVLTLAGNLSV